MVKRKAKKLSRQLYFALNCTSNISTLQYNELESFGAIKRICVKRSCSTHSIVIIVNTHSL